jgi:hypothetical protein
MQLDGDQRRATFVTQRRLRHEPIEQRRAERPRSGDAVGPRGLDRAFSFSSKERTQWSSRSYRPTLAWRLRAKRGTRRARRRAVSIADMSAVAPRRFNTRNTAAPSPFDARNAVALAPTA